MQNSFTEDDKQKVIELLNMVATHAEFKLSTQELIKYFGLLSYAQKQLIPKIEANILEVKRVIEPPKEAPKKETKAAKKAE